MRTTQSIAVLAALLSLGEGALNLVKRDNPAVVSSTTRRRSNVGNPIEHDRRKYGFTSLHKRQNVVEVPLANEVTLYFINVTLGTPTQSFALHIDTGSSDLWVNTASSALCRRYARYCDEGGVYDSSASSTYKFVNNDFNVSYADGSAATGPYVTDTLGVGSTTLKAFEFGVADVSSLPQGILGVGYSSNEGIASVSTELVYPNLPRALANAGDINSVAYSLWLNDLSSSEGSILFGGVNTARFSGSLHTLPVIPQYGYYSAFFVALTGVGLNGDAGSIVSNQAVSVLLDSGTSLTYLPNTVVDALYQEYNTEYNEREEAALVDCSLAQSSGSVDFTFSGLTISVPLSELILNVSDNPNDPICALGVGPSSVTGLAVMGDTFLRSAYVVYDLSNNEISMAQASYDTSADNILEIKAGSSGVPSAAAVASPVTSVTSQFTGNVGDIGITSFQAVSSTSTTDNAAAAMKTPNPAWKYGSGLVAGAAALAIM